MNPCVTAIDNSLPEVSVSNIAIGTVALGLITMFVVGILGAVKIIHMDPSAVAACLALPILAVLVPLIILLVILERCRRDCAQSNN